MEEGQKPIIPLSWRGLALRWLGWAAATTMGWLGGAGVGLMIIPGAETEMAAEMQRQSLHLPPDLALIQALQTGLTVGLVVGLVLALYHGQTEKRGLLRGSAVFATTLALAILFFVAANPAPREIIGDLLTSLSYYFAAGFAGGLIAGTGQYLLLRNRVSGYWIPVTTFAWALAFAVGIPTPAALFSEMSAGILRVVAVALPLASGAMIGVAQWLLLRRAFHAAGWWIPAWMVGWLLVDELGIPGVVLLGAITASVLVVLLRQPRAAAKPLPS